MKKHHMLWAAFVLSLLVAGVSLLGQMHRPYRNGSVWDLEFIQVKPGMDPAYLGWIASDWKNQQEALKAQGVILSYKVLQTEGHTPADWNLILMTEFKDLASLEANEAKADAVAQQVSGDEEKQMEGYKQRAAVLEVVGSRLAREIILEPRQ